MKKGSVGIAILVFILGFVFGAMLWIPATKKIMENRFQKEVEETDIYPTGSFTLTFRVNEDVVDLPAKEALTIVIEQITMDLAEAEASYRVDGNIEHIKIVGARLAGDKEEEARLKFWLKGGFIPRLSDKD